MIRKTLRIDPVNTPMGKERNIATDEGKITPDRSGGSFASLRPFRDTQPLEGIEMLDHLEETFGRLRFSTVMHTPSPLKRSTTPSGW